MQKRVEYWNHFVARWAIHGIGGGHGVTGPRLRRIEAGVMNDDEFWADIIFRHDGMDVSPEQMMRQDPDNYGHCRGNFWGMVYQDLIEAGLIS